MANKGQGKSYRWLVDHIGYTGDDCLKWPFSVEKKSGRGLLGHNGRSYWAHRLMCMLAHGDPPTPKHTAAHNCGKGHEGCVNPRHLAWKTQKENLADCAIHGTQPKHYHGSIGKLTKEKAEQIRALRGINTMGELARMFSVSEGAINDIWRGRTWTRPNRITYWKPDEIVRLREAIGLGMTFRQITAHVGTKSHSSVMMKTYRLGLSSGQPPHPNRTYR